MFTPNKSSVRFVEKGWSKSAAGTLLIIWLVINETKKSLLWIKFTKKFFMDSIFEMLFVKIKKQTKVRSKV